MLKTEPWAAFRKYSVKRNQCECKSLIPYLIFVSKSLRNQGGCELRRVCVWRSSSLPVTLTPTSSPGLWVGRGCRKLQITQAYPSLPKLGGRPEIPVENQMIPPIWEERNICSPKNACVVEFFQPFLVCSANLDIVVIRFVTVLC